MNRLSANGLSRASLAMGLAPWGKGGAYGTEFCPSLPFWRAAQLVSRPIVLAMLDADKLTPADPSDHAAALAFELWNWVGQDNKSWKV
jgi:hypothetical protein